MKYVDGFVVAVPADKRMPIGNGIKAAPLFKVWRASYCRMLGQRCTGWQSDRFSYGGESGRE